MGENEILMLLLGMVGLGLIALLGMKSSSDGPSGSGSDPFDVSELPAHSTLRPLEAWEHAYVKIYRQSGNLEREQRCETLEDAYKSAQATFRRAKSQDVRVFSGNEEAITFSRGFYNGRGRQEGKRIGYVKISIEFKDDAADQLQELSQSIKFRDVPIANEGAHRIARLARQWDAAMQEHGHSKNDNGETLQEFLDSLRNTRDATVPYTLRLNPLTAQLYIQYAYATLCSSITDETKAAILADENEEEAIKTIVAKGGKVPMYKVLDRTILRDIENERFALEKNMNLDFSDAEFLDKILEVEKYAAKLLK